MSDMTRLDEILSRASLVISENQEIKPGRDVVYLGEYDFGDDSVVRKLSRQSYETQWSVEDLPWERSYNPDEVVPLRDTNPRVPAFHPGDRWTAEEWQSYDIAVLRHLMSQLLFGEQLSVAIGGGLCTSGTSWDMKTFGGWLAVDETRHAETLHRYLERIGGAYQMSGQMLSLVEMTLTATEWDKSFLIGQVLVEGLGLGMLGHMGESYTDPLMVQMVRLIQRDEARHVAFGVSQLPELLSNLTAAELLERQQLLAHCTEIAIDKLVPIAVADEFGIDVRQYTRALRMSPSQAKLEQRVYSHVAPLCHRLGLLDANDGWLRRELQLLGLNITAEG